MKRESLGLFVWEIDTHAFRLHQQAFRKSYIHIAFHTETTKCIVQTTRLYKIKSKETRHNIYFLEIIVARFFYLAFNIDRAT